MGESTDFPSSIDMVVVDAGSAMVGGQGLTLLYRMLGYLVSAARRSVLRTETVVVYVTCNGQSLVMSYLYKYIR